MKTATAETVATQAPNRASYRPTMAPPASEADVIGALDDVLELAEITHPPGGYAPVSRDRAREVVARVEVRAAHRSGAIRAVKP
jgi:hypothetical protein